MASQNVDRRNFLSKVAVASSAAAIPTVHAAEPANKTLPATEARRLAPPSVAQLAADTGEARPQLPASATDCGSDFMVDVIKTLNID